MSCFFFSSRRRHTRWTGDWSSDVCSSDLELEPAYYDLTDADMDTEFNTGTFVGPEQASLREIIKALQETYCGTLGVEYMYLSSRVEKRWIQERLEPVRSRPSYSADTKRHILERLA